MAPIKFIPFSGVSKQEWLEKVSLDLKGKAPESLDRNWQDLSYKAFYHREDAPVAEPRRGDDNEWLVRKSLEVKASKEFNADLLSLLNQGLQNPVFRGEFKSEEQLKECLENVVPDYVRLDFELLGNPDQYTWIQGWLKENAKDFNALQGGLNLKGSSAHLSRLIESNFPYHLVSFYGSEWQAQGAYASTELAIVLDQIRDMIELNPDVDPSQLYEKSQVILGLGVNYFGELSKVRAARNLIDFLFQNYGAEISGNFFIACQSSPWTFSAYDRYNNLLRNSTSAMAAAIGGADAIELFPHDLLVKKPNLFSAHLGINIQHLMKEESYLARVSDPASGSYLIEDMTQKLEEAAWTKFQQLQEGASMEQMIGEDKAHQKKAFAEGEMKLLGVNLFPNLEEKLKGELEISLNGLSRLAFETESNRLKDE